MKLSLGLGSPVAGPGSGGSGRTKVLLCDRTSSGAGVEPTELGGRAFVDCTDSARTASKTALSDLTLFD